jgi:hypothetical protein
VVHHTGRLKSKQTPRGSSALDGHVDTVLVMRRDNNGTVTLENTKQRHSRLVEPIKLWPHDVPLARGTSSLVLMADAVKLRDSHFVVLSRMYRSDKPMGYRELIEETGLADRTGRNLIKDLLATRHVEDAGKEGQGSRKLFRLTGKTWRTPIWER